jgi:UDP-N-acetylmuramate: L-alanyl-gamma-D-glutamyl-meso-diaminopimelate ligase
LKGRHVLAVAGTHGKTTTSSMLAWILEHDGRAPGFLIGGVPANFAATARLGAGPAFVIEADEYDTAFFDKRAKFVHYGPRTAVLNNLEYDHADIYPDLASIQRQFNQLLRVVPAAGRVIVNSDDANLAATLKLGIWTPLESFGRGAGAHWTARSLPDAAGRRFEVCVGGAVAGRVDWPLIGEHNVMNALAAIAAAHHVGVAPERAALALAAFRGVKRRMEVRGVAFGVTVYDDFAHHPTAIETTLCGLRASVGAATRIHAVLEPRSNTMKLGVHREQLAPALQQADRSWLLQPADLGWDLPGALAPLGDRVRYALNVDELVGGLAADARRGDVVLVMSNGAFGGLHEKLLAALRSREA